MLIGGGPLRLSESAAVDGGNSDTRSIQVVSFHLRVTVWQEISSHLDLMPKTRSLKEDMGNYQCITPKTNSTLKASKVGHCASWSSWISCLQL